MQENYGLVSDWKLFLNKWNRELLDRIDIARTDYSSLFQVNRFVNAGNLCGRLKYGQDPLSRYLVSQFNSATRQLLEQYPHPNPSHVPPETDWVLDASGRYVPPNQPDPMLLKALVDELNRLLKGPLLYDHERFKGIQLSEQARSSIEKNPSGEGLVRLNRMLIDAAYPYAIGRNHDHLVETDISPEVIASGWLGYPGATEDQIASLEARLGKRLPPSYRAFLEVSNGFRQPGMSIARLLSTDEVEWFRVRNQETVDLWKSSDLVDLSDALEISIYHIDQVSIYLLDSKAIVDGGEWEAFCFNMKGGGSDHRYSSFWQLMQREYQYSVFYNGRGKGHLHRGDDLQKIIVQFPYLIEDLERKIQKLADNKDPSDQDWRTDVLKVLKAAKSQATEIGEKGSQPEVINQQLQALIMEFRDKILERARTRMQTVHYDSNRRDGIGDGYLMVMTSIRWFLGGDDS